MSTLAAIRMRDLAADARAIAAGTTTSRTLVEAALRRYDETEDGIHAFAWLDRERALRLADEADRARAPRGILHGVPVGVKDIFDTAGIPTENGSALFRGRVPDGSATIVSNLERAGAIVLGKTVTSELAFYHPGPTRNPHDPSRTPGGSSMGSAAAVAAGVVGGAVGSQTNGSIVRPAAFCGVVGLKPSIGVMPTDGVYAFAPTLDHPGPIASTVEGAALLAAAMAGDPLEPRWWSTRRSRAPRLAALRTSDWDAADASMKDQFGRVVDALASVAGPIEWPDPPARLDEGPELLQTIMSYEAVRSMSRYVDRAPELVSEVLRDLLAKGKQLSETKYRVAMRARDALLAKYTSWIERYDAVLTPPAFGEAPTPETTGNPRFCSRWSLLGVPAITIPTGRGPHGLPLGLQLVGAPRGDAALIATAAWAEQVLG